LDLRDYGKNNKIEKISDVNFSTLGKEHDRFWYQQRLHTLKQNYFSIFEMNRTLRNTSTHLHDNYNIKPYPDFLTSSRVPANTIIISNMVIFFLYHCLEILQTWCETFSELKLLNLDKITEKIKNEERILREKSDLKN